MAKMIVIPCVCPFCGKTTEIAVDEDALYDYRCCGTLVQKAFPTLSPAERELIITGMCFDCQSKIFGSDSDEDEDEDEDENEDWAEALWDDWDLEEGFDPYMGCYTEDC